MQNEQLIDDFQVYPTKLEYTNLLSDLISLALNIKLQIYDIKNGSELEAKIFSNNNDQIVHVLRILKSVFISLKDTSEELLKENLSEMTADHSDAHNRFIGELLDDQVDEESDFQLKPIQLFKKKNTDSDDSMISEISHCDALDNKSQDSLENICSNKKHSGESDETTLNSSEANFEQTPIKNLFAFSERDQELDTVFEIQTKPVDQEKKDQAACKEIFNQLNETQSQLPVPSFLSNTFDGLFANPDMNSTQQYGSANYEMGPNCTNFSQNQSNSQNQQPLKVKREIIDLSQRRFTGVLKFYNESKGFGFVGCEQEDVEIFLHGDD